MQPLLFSFFAGVLLPFAFAPKSIWPLSILSVYLLIYSLRNTVKPKIGFLHGFAYGLGAFGVGISWVYVSIHDFGSFPTLLAGLFTFLFVALFSLLPGLWCYLFIRFYSIKSPLHLLLAFPALGVITEWSRSHLCTGFPWLLYGYSQIDSPLRGYAPIFGVFGVSFIIMLIASCIYIITQFKNFSKKSILCASLILSATLSITPFLLEKNWTTYNNESHTVALAQSNFKPWEKVSTYGTIDKMWDIYSVLIEPHLEYADFILWPEHSVPLTLPSSKPFMDRMDQLGESTATTFVIGILEEAQSRPGFYYNGFKAVGLGDGFYYKRHLVPFGEYLPFSRTILPIAKKFNLPVSTIIPGREQPNIITPNTRILPTICYEIAYTNTVRKSLRKSNAYVIMNLSEDGWFGSSWGPLQHLEMARMRALENGRYVLRSTTSGVTAIINEKGEIIARLPQFERGVLRGEFKEFTKYTPWTYIGVYPLLAFMLILLAAILYSYRHKLKVIELDSLSLTSLAPKQAVNCQSNCAQLLEL